MIAKYVFKKNKVQGLYYGLYWDTLYTLILS